MRSNPIQEGWRARAAAAPALLAALLAGTPARAQDLPGTPIVSRVPA